MIWQAPENKALGISVITTRDSCDMSCTNSAGVVTEAKKKKNPPIVLFNRACAHLKQRNVNPSYFKSCITNGDKQLIWLNVLSSPDKGISQWWMQPSSVFSVSSWFSGVIKHVVPLPFMLHATHSRCSPRLWAAQMKAMRAEPCCVFSGNMCLLFLGL